MGPTSLTGSALRRSYQMTSDYVWSTDSTRGSLLLPSNGDNYWQVTTVSSATVNTTWWLASSTGTAATADWLSGNTWELTFDYNYEGTARYFSIIKGNTFTADPRAIKKMEMARRRNALLPSAKATRFGLAHTEDPAELKARQLLKTFIGGERFRRYLKDGFISITSPVTGLVYQIFPGHRQVVVRDKGTRTASCCIVFKDNSLPPTDWVIMRMSLIMADEKTFYQKANVSGTIPERLRIAA